MKAKDLRRIVPESMWCDYYKFTVVRNPWSQFLSYYYDINRTKEEREKMDIYKFAKHEARDFFEKQWSRYTSNDNVIVDKCIKLENIRDGLHTISNKLSLDENIYNVFKTIRIHSGYRGKKSRCRMDRKTAQVIKKDAKKIIETHGYSYNHEKK
jgi:hypothetical protein